jgi:hypothetical protein
MRRHPERSAPVSSSVFAASANTLAHARGNISIEARSCVSVAHPHFCIKAVANSGVVSSARALTSMAENTERKAAPPRSNKNSVE